MYAKVFRRMWRRGGSFSKLSGPPKPNAQHLWFYILTGDTGGSLPGVLVVDREVLIFKLGWAGQEKVFEACVEEIARAEMAAFDWEAGMIFCPAAMSYNKPQSPNVIIAWGKAFNMLPEGSLKGYVWRSVAAYVEELAIATDKGEAFREAFRKAFPKTYGDSSEAFGQGFLYSASVSASVSDSESKPKPKPKKTTIKPGDYDKSAGFNDCWEAYPNKKAKKVGHTAWLKAVEEGRITEAVVDGSGGIVVHDLLRHISERARLDPQWLKDDGQFIPMFSTYINQDRWTDEWTPKKSRQHVGAQQPKAEPTAEDKERRQAVNSILEYTTILLEADLPEKVLPIAKKHAKDLRELVKDDSKPKGILFDEFYSKHDLFIAAVFKALPKGTKVEIEAGREPKVNIDTWRRKRMREEFKLPDPLDVDPEAQL